MLQLRPHIAKYINIKKESRGLQYRIEGLKGAEEKIPGSTG